MLGRILVVFGSLALLHAAYLAWEGAHPPASSPADDNQTISDPDLFASLCSTRPSQARRLRTGTRMGDARTCKRTAFASVPYRSRSADTRAVMPSPLAGRPRSFRRFRKLGLGHPGDGASSQRRVFRQRDEQQVRPPWTVRPPSPASASEKLTLALLPQDNRHGRLWAGHGKLAASWRGIVRERTPE